MTRGQILRIRALSSPLEPRPTGLQSRLPALPGLRAVLFDVYGTLFISASGDIGSAPQAAGRGAAFQAALEACGLRPASPRSAEKGAVLLEQLIRGAHSRARSTGTVYPEVEIRSLLRAALCSLWREGEIPIRPGRRRATRFAVELEARQNPCWPMPDAAKILAALKTRGLTLGIISNAQFYTPLLFPALLGASHTRLGFLSSACIWSYRLLEAKPSEQLFQLAASALARSRGITPAQILYVGNDMRNDILPARSCGFRTALFAGDTRSLRLRREDPGCRGLTSDAVLTELSQLLRLIP